MRFLGYYPHYGDYYGEPFCLTCAIIHSAEGHSEDCCTPWDISDAEVITESEHTLKCVACDAYIVFADTPILPYAGTSGWSGSETSRQRASKNDSEGTTGKRQAITLDLLQKSGTEGLTWHELDELTDWGHGSASGVLSVLHGAGLIQRLTEIRGGSKVYVTPPYVLGRDTETKKQKVCRHCGQLP